MEPHNSMNNGDQHRSDVEMYNIKPHLGRGNREEYFNQLTASLQSDNESEFLQAINSIAKNDADQLPAVFRAIYNNNSLLTLAAKQGLATAVEKMINLGADINTSVDTTKGPLNALQSACIFGNWKVLDMLLTSPKVDVKNSGPLLSIVVKRIGEKVTSKCDYKKCFHLLLNHKDININEIDASNCTALHYAVKFNNSNAILALLQKGAYIGMNNITDDLPISNINPKILEKHFDSCITTNEFRRGEDNFEIQFDYTNFVPLQVRQLNKDDGKSSDDCRLKEKCPNEMTAIEYIAESNDLRHLIRHPLITSFLFVKWNRLAFIFYLNFILCLMFAVSTVLFTLLYNTDDGLKEIKYMMRVITFILTIYIILREFSQFRISPWVYLKSVENYLEFIMIVLIIILLFDLCHQTWIRTIVATVILLIGIEVFHLAGSLPFYSFSTHYVMLKTVITSFLKSLSLYAILLLSFSLAFYTLLRSEDVSLRSALGANDPSDSEWNKFNNIGLSIMKTLVMSTGEFDAGSIDFNGNPWSYIVFVAFLFIISTVLLNLLNGLAVSDIQAIKSEAELMNFIQRCQILARYEKALLQNRSIISFTCMKYLARDTISVFRKLNPYFRVGVKTNASNHITVPTDENTIEPVQCSSCISCFGHCSRMDSKIIKCANLVLAKVNAEKHEKDEEAKANPLKAEIDEMKITLEMIKNLLLKEKQNAIVN